MDILVGLILLALGLIVAFFGLRVFAILLPVVGFLAGMSLGVSIFHHFFDSGFLSTAGGIVVGVIIGIVFALLSYLFWYVAVILGGAFVGASLGGGLMELFNVNTQWVIGLAAIVGAVLLGILVVYLDLPLYWIIVVTAFAGATWAIGGFMLIINEIDRPDLEYGTLSAAIDAEWYWLLPWIVVAALGIGAQLARLSEALMPPEDRWTKLPSPQAQL